MWSASSKVRALYRSSNVRKIQEAAPLEPLICDDTNTLHFEESDLLLAELTMKSVEKAVFEKRASKIVDQKRQIFEVDFNSTHSIDILEERLTELQISIKNIREELKQIDKTLFPASIQKIFDASDDTTRTLFYMKTQMENLKEQRIKVSKCLNELTKYNSIYEAGESCMVFTRDLKANSLITNAVASCVSVCFICKMSNDTYSAALFHLKDHFALYALSTNSFEKVVDILMMKAFEKLKCSQNTSPFVYVAGGSMYNEYDYAMRSSYYASSVFAAENHWDGETSLDDFFSDQEVKNEFDSLSGKELRQYYKKWTSTPKKTQRAIDLYASFPDAGKNFISKDVQTKYLHYMKEYEPGALIALQDGEEYPLMLEKLLATRCVVLKRPYNLPSTLAVYDVNKMKPLTVAITMNHKLDLPVILVTQNNVELDSNKLLIVERNEDKLKGLIGLAIPTIDLDELSYRPLQVPIGFLELRAGTKPGEPTLVQFEA